MLAQGLSAIDGITIHGNTQTNMVFISARSQQALVDYLATKNIVISNRKVIRLVIHLDISAEDIDMVIDAVRAFYNNRTE